jgi:hypothetical protein
MIQGAEDIRATVLPVLSGDNRLKILPSIAPVTNVAAVQAYDDVALRDRQVGSVALAGVPARGNVLFRRPLSIRSAAQPPNPE